MKLQRCCLSSLLLCAMTANMALASAPFEIKLDSHEHQEYGEFGRSVKPKRRVAKHEPTEADLMYRELIEDVQIMNFASMSMSMGVSLDDNTNTQDQTQEPSAPPPAPATGTPAPTDTPTAPQTSDSTQATATAASCDGQPQVLINIPLEVDTADGSIAIETLIEDALTKTLSGEFNFCATRRRLEDGSSFQLGTITVTKDADQTCRSQVDPTAVCQVANAAIVVSGQVNGAAAQLRNSLGFLFENDTVFQDDLPQSGVIEVRLQEGSEESEVNSSVPSAFGNSAQPTRSAVVAILSTAGISIAAAIILRARRKELRADKLSEFDSESDTLPINNVSGSP